MNDLDLLRPTLAFATVVDLGSFRAAADRLNLSPPYVSQMISDLEIRLGRQLLYRSTRKIALTDDGAAFLAHARTMTDAFRDGVDLLKDRKGSLAGRLRINAPTILASPFFARVVTEFSAKHPDLRLAIDLDDRTVDPVEARVDLTIRIGNPGDDPRLARRLFTTHGAICVAPDVAEGIASPKDLDRMVWLRSPTTARRLALTGPDGEKATLAPRSEIVANNAALIRAMIAEGTGFALLPAFAIRDATERGQFARVLPDWTVPDVAVFALFTERRTALANARGFVDHLLDAIRRPA